MGLHSLLLFIVQLLSHVYLFVTARAVRRAAHENGVLCPKDTALGAASVFVSAWASAALRTWHWRRGPWPDLLHRAPPAPVPGRRTGPQVYVLDPNPGTELLSPEFQADSLPSEPPRVSLKTIYRASLAAQWLRILLPMQETQV